MIRLPKHTKLPRLRRQIARLRRRRALVRFGSAWSVILTSLMWAAIGAFLADWSFEMSRAQRVVLLSICAGASIWSIRRVLLANRGPRETDLDVALLVQRQRGIDSDLVAALQFETPDAASWGSVELENAVVDRVADLSRGIDVFEGFSARELSRRAILLAVTAALVLGAAFSFPDYANVFLNRCLLGSEHYPSDTIIEAIRVNGRSVVESSAELVDASGDSAAPRAPFGRPLEFEVIAKGEVPEVGRIELVAVESDLETTVELRADSANSRRFSGALPRLLGAVRFQVFLGDAWTEPRRIDVIPLPSVRLSLHATPPAYAATTASPASEESDDGGTRQISVLEGSRVDVDVVCENKRLERVEVTILGKTYALRKRDDAWTLPVVGTPLERVTRTLRFDVDIDDEDGLGLDSPLHGVVRIRQDRPPRASAAMVTEHVLPSARPTIRFGVVDDHGIARVSVRYEITRARASVETRSETLYERDETNETRLVRKSHTLDLAPLALVKGDRVKVMVEATDYRGEAEGESATSEALVLNVTDERGVLAAMVETDQRSARQLDAIIERQLGIGK